MPARSKPDDLAVPIDSVPSPLALLDHAGHLVNANPAWQACVAEFTHADFAAIRSAIVDVLQGARETMQVDLPAGPTEGRVGCRVVGTALAGGGVVLHATMMAPVTKGTHERDAYFRALFDNALDGIVILDDAGRYRAVNRSAAALMGLHPEQVHGRSIFDLVPADMEPMLRAHWTAFLRDGAQKGIVRSPVGDSACVVEFTARANFIPGRHLAHLRDVTDRERLEEQLRHSQKLEALGQLTGGIAHDFNNILTIILANASLAADLLEGEATEVRGLIAEMQSSAVNGAQMVRKLLAFARREQLALGLVSLPNVLADLARTLRRLLPATIDIRLDEPTGPGVVRADAGAVEQILLNLATNARDAMPAGGVLRLAVANVVLSREESERMRCAAPGEYVRFSVTDTGTGMSPDTQARIFEPFFTTKPRGAGTGLGLAMIHGLVQQHEGGIMIESEIGQGTTIHVLLPAAAPDEATVPTARSGSGDAQGFETILLAEDEELVQRAAVRVLRKQGYRVLAAGDGEQALALFQAHREEIGLVITDVVMPKMGGSRLVDAVRALRPDTPILCTSGYAERSSSGERALPEGVPFLHKPWRTADLLDRVRTLLDTITAPTK